MWFGISLFRLESEYSKTWKDFNIDILKIYTEKFSGSLLKFVIYKDAEDNEPSIEWDILYLRSFIKRVTNHELD